MNAPHELSEAQQHSMPSAWLSPHVWWRFLALVVPLVGVVCLYLPTARSLVRYWNDTDNLTYTHGWMVLAIVAWLLFDTARQLPPLVLRTSWRAMLAVLGVSTAWLLAYQVNVQVMQHVLLPALGLCVLWALYGSDIARRCVFALGYLYFAVPLWGELNSLLQWGTVFAVRAAVRVVSIPAYFEENTIHLPSGVIAVEGGCSGLHFFIVGLALAVLYGYVNRIATKWRLLLLAAGLAILANWVRVFVILVAGYLTDMQHYLVRVEHYRFGWVVFAVAMTLFFFIAHRMRQLPLLPPATQTATAVPTHRYASLLWCAVALAALPGYRVAVAQRAIGPVTALSTVIPPGWTRDNLSASTWRPVFVNADIESLDHFTRDGVQIDVYRAVYSVQTQHKKLAAYDNSPLGELPHGMEVVSTPNAAAPFVEYELADAGGHRELVWYVYHVDGRWFKSALRAQMWSGVKALTGASRAGVLALHVRCAADCEASRQMLAAWAERATLQKLIAPR